jgi:hypothetical protein
VCPQSGDAEAGLSALVYGVPAPRQVTVLPSPGCQVTDTGVAVAVTLSPGTVAVFDSGTHSAGLIHSHVGRFTSCKAACAGLERITGLGSPRVWRASAASTAGSGGAGPPPGAGAAAPTGHASVCTVTWQPAGTQPNVLFTVPWHPPAAPPPAAVPVADWPPAWGPALAGVPADGPDPAVTSHWGEYD